MKRHVVITGTGRTGTTFLVEVLTQLGLDTGFSKKEINSKKSKRARAGLEKDINDKDCPYIFKSPWFCDYAEDIIKHQDIIIEHVFIPMRNLHAAAQSRRYVQKGSGTNRSLIERIKNRIKPNGVPGGLWHTGSPKSGKQEEILLKQLYKLLIALSDSTIPVTLMHYPRITNDCDYLFEKLKPVLKDITYESFCIAFKETVQPKLVHSFNEKDI